MTAVGRKDMPIGVFDSGFGGITVLAQLIKNLPWERFIYYADSAHAPYGAKSAEEIKNHSLNVVGYLQNQGIKALVVACNTATSVAVNTIRERLTIPVVGMEPALKPAIEHVGDGAVVVMATPVTLGETKFRLLMNKFEGQKEIIPLPCPGLVEIIEAGYTSGDYVVDYLHNLYKCLDLSIVDSIVLGCTHYVFIRNELRRLTGKHINIVDGNAGTARRLTSLLKEAKLQRNMALEPLESRVQFHTSGHSGLIPQCWSMLSKALDSDLQ